MSEEILEKLVVAAVIIAGVTALIAGVVILIIAPSWFGLVKGAALCVVGMIFGALTLCDA